MLRLILILSLFIAGTSVSSSQEYTKKNRKVNIFTSEEKDNLQQWYHHEIDKIGFNQEEEDEYFSVLTYYVVKMARLDDKDKDFTKEELKIEAEKLLAKQDAELKLALSAEQYAKHQEIFGEFIRAVYTRWGIE